MATTIADGDGRNSALTQPALPANCQNAITSASAIQPEARPARGEKPAPRKATGRVSSSSGFAACDVARTSILHLALAVARPFAGQRRYDALRRSAPYAPAEIRRFPPPCTRAAAQNPETRRSAG